MTEPNIWLRGLLAGASPDIIPGTGGGAAPGGFAGNPQAFGPFMGMGGAAGGYMPGGFSLGLPGGGLQPGGFVRGEDLNAKMAAYAAAVAERNADRGAR